MTKNEMIRRLPPDSQGEWREYVRTWRNRNGTSNGINGHIQSIWREFYDRCHREFPSRSGRLLSADGQNRWRKATSRDSKRRAA